MLGYLEDSEDLKVGIRKLKNSWKRRKKQVLPPCKLPNRQGMKKAKKIFDFLKQGEEVCIASFARWNTQLKSLADLERLCQGMTQEVKLLSERQEVLKGMVEDKIRLQSRATEKYCEQILEEMKELKGKKSKEALSKVKGIKREDCKDREVRE